MGKTRLDGAWGEALAAEHLKKKRYKLVACGYQCRFGEIDLIVKNRKYLVFVEVKLRKNDRFGAAADAVTLYKRDKLKKTALAWLAATNCTAPTRFDVIEVYLGDTSLTNNPAILRIEHLEDAFRE